MPETKAKINDGGSAFPIPTIVGINGAVHDFTAVGGMTLRDYFAAKAMQGFCILPPSVTLKAEKCAADSYALADAMLIARKASR
jgi:hypothetical protein